MYPNKKGFIKEIPWTIILLILLAFLLVMYYSGSVGTIKTGIYDILDIFYKSRPPAPEPEYPSTSCYSTCRQNGYEKGECVSGTMESKTFDYGLWLSRSDFSTTEKTQDVLQFIGDGKFDLVVLTATRMLSDNTLWYDEDNINNIVSAIKTEYPQIEVWIDVYSWDSDSHSGAHDKATESGFDIPDFSTSALRQKSINEIVKFWNKFSGKFEGIVDDCEVYYGTSTNHLNYFSEVAAELESMGVPYYPWLYYKELPYTTAKRAAVGLYGAHSYHEDEWKNALIRVQTDAASGKYPKDGYMIWIITEHGYTPSEGLNAGIPCPTVAEQLQFFDEIMADTDGTEFFSKMESFGVWWYYSMTDEDKNDWISWVNRATYTTSSTEFWWGASTSNTAWGEWVPGGIWGYMFGKTQIDVAKQSGATAIRLMLDKNAWDSGSTGNILHIPYKDYIKQLVSWSKPEMRVLVELVRDSRIGEFMNDPEAQRQVIENPSAWINWGKEVIAHCNPDAISLMGEPRGGTSFDYYYDNFVIPSIEAYRSVDPNIIVFVMGSPFHDLSGFARRPINDDKVIYQFHFYYNYPIVGEVSQLARDMLNAYGEGRLTEAKNYLTKYFDWEFAGIPKSRINFGELGVYDRNPFWDITGLPNRPNWEAFMQDAYDYIKQQQLHGMFQYGINPTHYCILDPATDYTTLTPYGEVWTENIPTEFIGTVEACPPEDDIGPKYCDSPGETCCCSGVAPPIEFRPLHVDGRYIKNDLSQTVILRGISGPQPWWWEAYGDGVEKTINYAKDWGINVYRLPLTWTSYYEDGYAYDEVEEAIQVAKELGIYLIIGEWSSTVEPEPDLGWDKFKQYWERFASEHTDDWHILYNILNEPYDDGSGKLTRQKYQAYMEEITDLIRKHVPNAVVVIDGLEEKSYGGERSSLTSLRFLQTNPIRKNNILYDVHVYGGYDRTVIDNIDNRYVGWATQNNYAVFIGETNVFTGGDTTYWWEEDGVYVTDQTSIDWFDATLTEFDNRQLGYAAWAFIPRNFPPLIEDWHGTPNQAGEVLIKHIKGTAPPPTSKLQNCVWMIPYKYLPWEGHYVEGLGNELDNPQYMIDRLDGLNIDCIGVHGGSWKSDGTIAYDSGTTFEMWTNFINAMKAWNPDIKVLVWVIAWDTADLSDPDIRNKMYDSAEYLLNSVPFDGWNDDYEGWSGDSSDIVTFWQGLASRVKSMGKLATVATEVDWDPVERWSIEDVYPYLTNFDYIMPMYYSKISTANAADYWNRVLSNSPVPVIMGLAVLEKQNGGTPFSEQLTWIDEQSHSNLAGFGIWAYDYMSYEDLEAWDNWATKDTIGS